MPKLTYDRETKEYRFFCQPSERFPAKDVGFYFHPNPPYWFTYFPSTAKHLSKYATQSALDALRAAVAEKKKIDAAYKEAFNINKAFRQDTSPWSGPAHGRMGDKKSVLPPEEETERPTAFLDCPACGKYSPFSRALPTCVYCDEPLPDLAAVLSYSPADLLTVATK